MDMLREAAGRCAKFETFFDPSSPGIPITTTELSGLDQDALAYQQTMKLDDLPSSVYMAFQNVGRPGVRGSLSPRPIRPWTSKLNCRRRSWTFSADKR